MLNGSSRLHGGLRHSEAFSPSRQAAPQSRSDDPGYAYREPFTYDYKKNFSGLEYLDWSAGWKNYTASAKGTQP